MILQMIILTHKHPLKILPHAHHTSLHTYTDIHMKILTCQSVTRTRKYYTYKKLSQSTHLIQLHCKKLRKLCNRKNQRYGTRLPYRTWEEYKFWNMNTLYSVRNWAQTKETRNWEEYNIIILTIPKCYTNHQWHAQQARTLGKNLNSRGATCQRNKPLTTNQLEY